MTTPFRRSRIFFVVSLLSAVLTTAAHEHTDRAFQAIIDASTSTPTPIRSTNYSDASTNREAWGFNVTFTLPLEQQPLIADLYAAMQADAATCTMLHQQDAYSAHTWSYTIALPSTDIRIATDARTNLLLGGFIDATTRPTSYHYYGITWQPSPDGTALCGRLFRYRLDAITQQPSLRQPSRAAYAAIPEAYEAFSHSSEVTTSRSCHTTRGAATGQWLQRYHTIGFRLPLSSADELLAPIVATFSRLQPKSYRFLSKQAGVVAENVCILLGADGSNISLGAQRDWNITYAYFADNDFPLNRYVYALWYYHDQPNGVVVGELLEINCERPTGGLVVNPFTQHSVPDYLYAMGTNIPASTLPTFTVREVHQLPSTTLADGTVIRLPTPIPDSTLTVLRQIERILSPNEVLQQRYSTEGTMFNHSDQLRQRGIDLDSLKAAAEAAAQAFAINGHLYQEELQLFSRTYAETTQRLQQSFKDAMQQLRDSYQSATLDSTTLAAYHSSLTEITKTYTQSMEQATASYNQQLSSLRTTFGSNLDFFSASGTPSAFITSLRDSLLAAYHADGTLTDAYVASKLSLLSQLTAAMASPEEQRHLRDRLTALRATSTGTLSDEALANAIVTLGGYRHTGGTSPKAFRRAFKKEYAASRRALRRFTRYPSTISHAAAQQHLTNLSRLCQQATPLLLAQHLSREPYTNRLHKLHNQLSTTSTYPYAAAKSVDLLNLIEACLNALYDSDTSRLQQE